MAAKANVLTPRQLKAIEALTVAKSQNAAAKEVGVSPEQLRRWMRQPLFSAELTTRQDESLAEFARQLQALSAGATAAFASALRPDTAIEVRVSAADKVSKHLLAIRSYASLEARMADLENAVALAQAQQQELISGSVERGEMRKIDYRVALRETDPRHESD